MKILSFDTSAKTAAVAVVDDRNVLATAQITTNLTHSQTLLPLCEQLLHTAGITLADIDCFAVSNGPGSFTGLRIGIGTVKGLAQGINKPCIGVSTLQALCYNYYGLDGVICAAMDARRNQVYTAIYDANGMQCLLDDCALPVEELGEILNQYPSVTLVGDGAKLVFRQLTDKLSGLKLAPPALLYQNAASVALAAFDLLEQSEPLQAEALTPRYLRLPQAERERMEKEQKILEGGQ